MKSPPKEISRLTQGRIKNSIFDIIGNRIEGARVLDLFCGSGSLGFEAISRGAETATLIDKSPKCVKILKGNIITLGIADKTRVICGDVINVLARLTADEKYNVVFLDPPYQSELIKKSLIKLDRCDILSNQVLLVVEHSRRLSLPAKIGGFIRPRQEIYGDTGISFYEKE